MKIIYDSDANLQSHMKNIYQTWCMTSSLLHSYLLDGKTRIQQLLY